MNNTWKYADTWAGDVFRYRTPLRPVASIGYDAIPCLLLEPGGDPDGTRRDFATYQPLPEQLVKAWELEVLS